MELKRRQLLTEPGDTLLLSKSSLESFSRFAVWQEATGMRPEDFSSNALCAVPIPYYRPTAPGQRRFANVNPTALWHPLFWLPERLAGEYRLATGPNGEMEPESPAVHSARIAMELTNSGLYDPETGGWVDILDSVGISVDNPADVQRIAAWQAGRPDPILDSIDLDPYLRLPNERVTWALESVLTLIETLTKAQWAILADSLIDLINDAAQPDNGSLVSMDRLRDATAMAAFLASLHLSAVPTDANEESSVFWTRMETAARTGHFPDVNSFLSGPVQDASGWLYLARDTYWESVEDLKSLQSA